MAEADRSRTTKQPELRFRALLARSSSLQLEFARAYE